MPAGWSSLRAVLLARLTLWLGDANSLLSLQSACKAWNSLPREKLDAAWKQQFLLDFEGDSMNHACVAVDGESTAFVRRYAARMAIERRWYVTIVDIRPRSAQIGQSRYFAISFSICCALQI